MARFKRLEVYANMEATGLVPVFYTPDLETAKNTAKACFEGGAVCIEMTNRGDGAAEVFKELQAFCKKEIPQAILGVGSIVDAPTAALYISYGANFVVGPVLDEETAVLCNKRKVAYLPGCGSATEIHLAEALGVEICKIFPGAEVGGPAFAKAIKGPCPWTSLMPTGGVECTEASLKAWFDAGVSCVGIGSNLVTKAMLEEKAYASLKEAVKNTLLLIKKVRGK